MDHQQIIGALSFIIGLCGTAVYIRSIFKGETHPHFFTWIVWAIISGIGFAAQIHDRAGPGSWALFITAFSCFLTALLALKYGEKIFTRGDKLALLASLAAIVPWLLTKDPLGSVILASIIDCIAFYPTFRKSWHKPGEEHLTAYYVANIKFILSFFAMENFTLNTMLYTSAVLVANSAFIVMCHWKRHVIASATMQSRQ